MTLPQRIGDAIWDKSGLDRNVPKSCYTLSILIYQETGEKLGENTLKRVLGLLNDEREPHVHTLDVLARYLGYRNWEQIARSLSPGDSGFSNMEGVFSADLTVGQRIVFRYAPEREVEVEFQGGARYVVIRSEGSSLKAGDILELGGIHPRFPLVVHKVIRDGKNLGQYFAAEKLGIESVKLV